jgi:hypothetical protein
MHFEVFMVNLWHIHFECLSRKEKKRKERPSYHCY